MSMDSIPPIKRHHLANWIKKEDPKFCLLQETHLIDRNKHWLRVNAGRKFTKPMALKTSRSCNIYIKVKFRLTMAKQDKEGHFIIIKGAIYQKEISYQTICTQY
jgi:hypothetical protein